MTAGTTTLGFIERRYRSCDDDRSGTPNNDNSTHKKKSDLCWAGDNVVMSLGGSATSLVRDDATGKWVAQNDTGARIEYKAKDGSTKAAQTGKYDGEHWIVTTPDGTRYWFGRGTLPGRATATNSTATVPVFGNHSGEPCHATAYADSSCTQAWRWNLDYVEDVHGNAMIVDWKKEQNRYAKNEKFAQAVSYDRDSYPTQILYGLRADDLDERPRGQGRLQDRPALRRRLRHLLRHEVRVQELPGQAALVGYALNAPLQGRRQELLRHGADLLEPRQARGGRDLRPAHPRLHRPVPGRHLDAEAVLPEAAHGHPPPLWLESITRTGHNRPGSRRRRPTRSCRRSCSSPERRGHA